MKILNHSYRTDKQLEPLIEYAKSFFDNLPLWLTIDDYHESGYFTYGEANGIEARVFPSTGITYPAISTHRKSVGGILFKNWREEFLFVLAHELRHVDQNHMISIPYHYEVDAELYAQFVLDAYRNRVSV